MTISKFIKAIGLTFCLLGSSASAVQAQNLTAAERSVCGSLKVCLDIVRRHDASEFDYTALSAEFRRFGPAGKPALFALLESDAGHEDIAKLISNMGPLTQTERRRIQEKWSPKKAQTYLPLLLDGHPMSRDLLLQSLDHPNAKVRETVRRALLRLPATAKTAPLPRPVQAALISALQKDPMSEGAPYLARSNIAGNEAQFAGFLRSGNSAIVTAAYGALYRRSPAQAFNMLLAEMARMDGSAQSRAVGQMLAIRHRSRPDGFYLNFARDMSGDPKLSVPARASGLHAVLEIAEGPFPALTPERAEALSFLVNAQPFIVKNQYLPYLKNVRAEAAMDLIWSAALTEKWTNRDQITEFFETHKSSGKIIGDLIQSNDARSFKAGLQKANPSHGPLIRRQINSPVNAIADLARQKLGLSKAQSPSSKCRIKSFDLDDMRNQMPFFESGWMVSDTQARISLTRPHLKTAHPSSTGWLAGYNLSKHNKRTAHSGGTLVHFDNKSGEFEAIGDFSGPMAILPSRPLEIGQTTDQFWVVSHWGKPAADVTAYLLDLGDGKSHIKPVEVLPKMASGFAVAPNGDLLISFADVNQLPIRLSQTGTITLACSHRQPAIASPAPR